MDSRILQLFPVALTLFSGATGCSDYAQDDYARDPQFSIESPSEVLMASGGWSAHVVLPDKRAVSWGSNATGELGLGHSEDVLEPELMRHPDGSVLTEIRSIAGSMTTYAVTQNGRVLAYGPNTFGSLGIGLNEYGTLFCGIEHTASATGEWVVTATGERLEKIVKIAAGHAFAVAIDEEGRLWTWGSNEYGQLANGVAATCADDPSLSEAISMRGYAGLIDDPSVVDERFTAVEAGIDFVLALTADGRVYSWGANRYGQLGHSGRTKTAQPRLVLGADGQPIEHVVEISAGGRSAMALTEEGRVLSWGANQYGQIGNGESGDFRHQLTPTVIEQLHEIVAIDVGQFHAMALTKTGEVFAWGSSELGVLGQTLDGAEALGQIQTRPLPVLVQDGHKLKNIIKILVAHSASYALDTDGQLFAWGGNAFGQLGTGRRSTSEFEPHPVKVRRLNPSTRSSNQ